MTQAQSRDHRSKIIYPMLLNIQPGHDNQFFHDQTGCTSLSVLCQAEQVYTDLNFLPSCKYTHNIEVLTQNKDETNKSTY